MRTRQPGPAAAAAFSSCFLSMVTSHEFSLQQDLPAADKAFRIKSSGVTLEE
jgi:hypothetical protein